MSKKTQVGASFGKGDHPPRKRHWQSRLAQDIKEAPCRGQTPPWFTLGLESVHSFLLQKAVQDLDMWAILRPAAGEFIAQKLERVHDQNGCATGSRKMEFARQLCLHLGWGQCRTRHQQIHLFAPPDQHRNRN